MHAQVWMTHRVDITSRESHWDIFHREKENLLLRLFRQQALDLQIGRLPVGHPRIDVLEQAKFYTGIVRSDFRDLVVNAPFKWAEIGIGHRRTSCDFSSHVPVITSSPEERERHAPVAAVPVKCTVAPFGGSQIVGCRLRFGVRARECQIDYDGWMS